VVVVAGLTVILLVVAPVLQVYVLAPVALKTVEVPEQMVGLLTATVGFEITVTVTVLLELQPLVVPLTV
jgi:hypothetical protein